jgi:hypothetical protein
MFSCPEGPEWDPCVCLSGTGRWERISDDAENDDGTLSDAAVMQRLSVARLRGRMRGPGDEAEVLVGIEINHGAVPLHRSAYLNIMPRLTVVNHSHLALEVPSAPPPPAAAPSRPLLDCAYLLCFLYTGAARAGSVAGDRLGPLSGLVWAGVP